MVGYEMFANPHVHLTWFYLPKNQVFEKLPRQSDFKKFGALCHACAYLVTNARVTCFLHASIWLIVSIAQEIVDKGAIIVLNDDITAFVPRPSLCVCLCTIP